MGLHRRSMDAKLDSTNSVMVPRFFPEVDVVDVVDVLLLLLLLLSGKLSGSVLGSPDTGGGDDVD